MQARLVTAGLCLVVIFAGCRSGDSYVRATPEALTGVSEPAHPWTDKPLLNDPECFQFAIVSDRNGANRPGVFSRAVEKLNLMQPEFVICVGDLIAGYTENRDEVRRQWDEFDSRAAGLEMPFFYLVGNHDITNPAMAEVWAERHGRSYYHFVYHGVLFLCLNSEDGHSSELSDAQIDYFEKVLADHADARWTLAFLHKPAWIESEPVRGWERFVALLAGRPHTVFAGHHHDYAKYERNGNKYIKLATTGGGSELKGPDFGQFDHFVWVTMTPDGPRIANVLIDGVLDENVVTEDIARMRQTLQNAEWIRCAGIPAEADRFTDGVALARLSNPADLPLKVSGTVRAHEELRITPTEFDLTLDPKSEQVIRFVLRAEPPIPFDRLQPIELEVKATYQPPGRSAFSQEHVHRIFFDRKRACAAVKGISIDGKLDEWPEAFIAVRTPGLIQGDPAHWTGPQDCWYRFATGRDDQYLYLAMESFDDDYFNDPERNAYEQDGFYVFIDARPDPQRSRGPTDWSARFAEFLPIIVSPGQSPLSPNRYEADRIPGGVQVACIRTDQGVAAEMAIPAAYLDQQQDEPWQAFRLGIAATDVDESRDRVVLWWLPRWGTVGDFDGSGTFVRR